MKRILVVFSLAIAAPAYADRFDLSQWDNYEEARPWREVSTSYYLLFSFLNPPFTGEKVCADMSTYAMTVGRLRDSGLSRGEMQIEAENTPWPISDAEAGLIELAYDRSISTEKLIQASSEICLDSYDQWASEQ